MHWTGQMDSILTNGWNAGYTAPQIANLLWRRLGLPEITASAVRGRRVFLGLRERGRIELAHEGTVTGRGGRPRRTRALPPDTPAPSCAPIPWASRAFNQCAYPVGDPLVDAMCCGGEIPAHAKRPYCPYHAELTTAATAA